LANPSASWFTVGKHAVRRRMVEQISQEDHCAYLYSSLLGCDATRLVFDGSCFLALDGQMLREARRFVFTSRIEMVDAVIDLGEIRQRRMETGSWREQVRDVLREPADTRPQRVRVPGEFGCSAPQEAVHHYWIPTPRGPLDPSLEHFHQAGLFPRPLDETDLAHLELELALCLALRDYKMKTGAPGYCLALSGGRDSAMVAVLVRRMFLYDNPTLSKDELDALVKKSFACAYMATRNSSETTRSAAEAVAQDCAATWFDGDVDGFVEMAKDVGQGMLGRQLRWDVPSDDLALQNVQARARSVIIWMIANAYNFILLATSNKSEAAVGYTTMDGDTSGGLSPLADVPKSLIQRWLAWAGDTYDMEGVQKVFRAPATAELRPSTSSQTDEDDLMPFVVLDQLMYHFVQRAQEPAQILRSLWPTFRERYAGDPKPFADHIARFVRMLCRAQWKRERFAISFRVMPFDLDPKGGFRFPPVQAGFQEELDEMYKALDELRAQG
jgi:NAD+ synthase (glutamine-hydrolysing)